ncbi:UNVERIFIED_CONTAM: hypothetical protein K2H54_037542 [Gekko kuhli]
MDTYQKLTEINAHKSTLDALMPSVRKALNLGMPQSHSTVAASSRRLRFAILPSSRQYAKASEENEPLDNQGLQDCLCPGVVSFFSIWVSSSQRNAVQRGHLHHFHIQQHMPFARRWRLPGVRGGHV